MTKALRPEPEETQEQRIHHDVLVDGADPVGRHRLDHADQKPRDQRARHAAETAERHRDEGDDAQRLADGRRDVEECRDQRARQSGCAGCDRPGDRLHAVGANAHQLRRGSILGDREHF
jgi:hypothetical protein